MTAQLGCTIDGRHLGLRLKGILRTPHQRLPKDEPDQSTSNTSTPLVNVTTIANFQKYVYLFSGNVAFPVECSDYSQILEIVRLS